VQDNFRGFCTFKNWDNHQRVNLDFTKACKKKLKNRNNQYLELTTDDTILTEIPRL
jgi:hypothetical protein